VTLRLASADVPKAEALLEFAGAETITLRDAADDPVYEPEPGAAPLWPTVTLEALFPIDAEPERLRSLLMETFPDSAPAVDNIDDSLWQTRLAQAAPARAVGSRLYVLGADEHAVPDGRIAVRLHMGLAFGTGDHPTTASCLEWLDAHVRGGMTLLDYGCGSGVLALAALALGARYAYAIDNDPQALIATRANAALNGAAARLFVGLPEELPVTVVDVLVANILAGPLIELAPTLARRVVPGGMLVLSGILERQAGRVAEAYAPHFEDLEQHVHSGWVRLTGRRKTG
jgi:ribosomal protein L11 methyltransferase